MLDAIMYAMFDRYRASRSRLGARQALNAYLELLAVA